MGLSLKLLEPIKKGNLSYQSMRFQESLLRIRKMSQNGDFRFCQSRFQERPHSILMLRNAGNQISIFSTTDGTNIQLDGNAPVLDEVLLSTSNDNQSLAKGGDFITLTIEASETIRKPDVKLLGNNLFAAGTETDLIGFYPFSGNPRDYSGNSHHAFPEGSIVLGGDRFGNDNQSYAFDGVNDYLKIQHHTDFNLSNQISISV